MICHDARNPRAREIHAALRARLSDDDVPEGLVIAIGGDGFMLRTIGEFGLERTYLGLNAGHLGFLLNDVKDWDEVVQCVRTRSYRTWAFPLLAATIHTVSGQVLEERAMNDVYLERSTGQTARLALSIDQHRVVEALTADGIIFSTALGSTAYTFSAGGTPCHPTLETLSVTPICPHQPRLSPFVLPATARARVDVQMPERRPVRAVADGRSVENVCRVDLGIGQERVVLAWLKGHDFTSHLVRKILHP